MDARGLASLPLVEGAERGNMDLWLRGRSLRTK
jgi:hypothetical protein